MTIQLFDAPAGAGKTRALARHADALAKSAKKVLFIQPTKVLITRTIIDELEQLDPQYPFQAIHGGTSGSVVRDLIAYFKDADPEEGEILFATHAAFFLLPYIHRRRDWTLIVDEVPSVDIYEELRLIDTYSLFGESLILRTCRGAYDMLIEAEAV